MSDSVGYGKPPLGTRFKKGQSGNPKGRPKGSRNLSTVLGHVSREKVRVTENGKVRTMTKSEAMVRQLIAKALAGDLRAIKDVFGLHQIAEATPDMERSGMPDVEKDQAILRRFLERTRKMQMPAQQLQGAGDER